MWHFPAPETSTALGTKSKLFQVTHKAWGKTYPIQHFPSALISCPSLSHWILQPLGFQPYLNTAPPTPQHTLHPYQPLGTSPYPTHTLASTLTHIYTLNLKHFLSPQLCLNNFYSPNFTSWFKSHLIWESLPEPSSSRLRSKLVRRPMDIVPWSCVSGAENVPSS